MKTIPLLLLALLLTGCTVHGGWPRFLRPSEVHDREITRNWDYLTDEQIIEWLYSGD